MGTMVLSSGIFFSQIILALSCILSMFRIVIGPRAQDRVIGFDCFYIVVMMLFITFDIKSKTTIYFEIAFVIGLLGFVSSVALAKFLMRGEVIE